MEQEDLSMLEPSNAKMMRVFGPLYAPLVPAYGTPLKFKIIGAWSDRVSLEVTVFTGFWIRRIRFITRTQFMTKVLELED